MQKVLLPVLLVISSLVGCNSHLSGDNAVDKSKAAQARLALGMAYFSDGDMRAARSNLERAVSYAPKDYRTQLGMAIYQQSIGENDFAESRFQQALALAPDNGDVMNNYGIFLCSLGQYESALAYFDDAVKLQNSEKIADSFENSGYCLLKAGQFERATETLSRALKQDPQKGARLLRTATEYYQRDQRAEAMALLNSYQDTLPDSAESLWMQIQFAALESRLNDVQRYGQLLAQDFSQSKQYQLFLAHEY
ncbi:type IV pilus biogenesis/stability protein PilW [Budvicia aquatica]|uniref:type IV pilus biogenesis/stability protein PilW n=1 Tax=Budvicia aquatica TaxID=82979 RepID=UPI002084AACC|nr:type IV pilus biogenesis/stability protein PilW [Budvicia aquatica]GKX51321.1 type IV pilus biogenesis/stability protein PilW [Budvicia aquatica]